MMTVPIPCIVRSWLYDAIAEIANYPDLYVLRPGKDFTRKRELDLNTAIQMLICMGR